MTALREAAQIRAARVAAPADRPSQRRNAPEAGSGCGVRAEIHAFKTRKADDGGPVGFAGFATITDTPYEMYDMFGPYNEVVQSTAPARALESDPDVNFVLNHGGVPFARTKSGTMTLSAEPVPDGEFEGREALKVDVPHLDLRMPSVLDVVYAMERGDLDEMSFKFRITSGEWSPDYETYTISQFDIHRGDVSIVNYGANPFTSGGLRSGGLDAIPAHELRAELERRGQWADATRGLTLAQIDALAVDLRDPRA
jgi:phage head maturation protease